MTVGLLSLALALAVASSKGPVHHWCLPCLPAWASCLDGDDPVSVSRPRARHRLAMSLCAAPPPCLGFDVHFLHIAARRESDLALAPTPAHPIRARAFLDLVTCNRPDHRCRRRLPATTSSPTRPIPTAVPVCRPGLPVLRASSSSTSVRWSALDRRTGSQTLQAWAAVPIQVAIPFPSEPRPVSHLRAHHSESLPDLPRDPTQVPPHSAFLFTWPT